MNAIARGLQTPAGIFNFAAAPSQGEDGMSIKRRFGVDDAVLAEDWVGSARHRICYPGVSSCITVTGSLASGLIGAHVTVSTTPKEFEEMLRTMRTGGGGQCLNVYVVGSISAYKSDGPTELNTRKKLRDKIESTLAANTTVRFFETPRDVHVFSVKTAAGPQFSWVKQSAGPVNWFANVYPAFPNPTLIGSHQFVIR